MEKNGAKEISSIINKLKNIEEATIGGVNVTMPAAPNNISITAALSMMGHHINQIRDKKLREDTMKMLNFTRETIADYIQEHILPKAQEGSEVYKQLLILKDSFKPNVYNSIAREPK